jgi:ABC-type multidrug transport system ATPase subunit
MDPGARRYLWDALMTVLSDKRSIVLTSHSMEECEALCTRLAIMVNGRFQCIGAPQHLKSRFGKGYTLIMKVRADGDKPGKTGPAKDFVGQSFAGATLVAEYNGQLTYNVPDTHKWAALFGTLEANKDRLELDDYSVSQTSLEQIFLGFAAHQQVAEDQSRKSGCKKYFPDIC